MSTLKFLVDLQEYGGLIQQMLGKLITQEPTEPVGSPFPNINGPESLDTPIGIVGAGPSGVHMAYSLKRAGYT